MKYLLYRVKQAMLFVWFLFAIVGFIFSNVAFSSDMSSVNEITFSPIIGQAIKITKPVPGQYGSLFHYKINKLITRESTQSQLIEGGATLELSELNQVNACFAVHSKMNSSQSKYITQDGKNYYYTRDDYFLMGSTGNWVANKDNTTISIVLSKSWRQSCMAQDETSSQEVHIELECVSLSKNDRLPTSILACKLLQNHSVLNKIAFNLEDTPDAGPFSFQNMSPSKIKSVTGERWLLLGSNPGLKITSIEGRRKGPVINFMKSSVIIREKNFLKQSR